MKRLAFLAVEHTAMWALMYLAFVAGMPEALNVLKFAAWAMLPLCALCLAPDVVKVAAQAPPAPVQRFLSLVKAWALLLCLVWLGHFFTGTAWALAMLFDSIRHSQMRELRKAAAEAQP